MQPRVTVLLGAGASVDAGLPLTNQLAQRLVTRANDPLEARFGESGWVRALNFAYGSMVGYQARDGSNPLKAVNIEKLISALRLLQNTQAHEVAPFVASWSPGARGLGAPSLDRSLSRQVLSGISTAAAGRSFFAEGDIVDGIAAIARAAVGNGDTTVFAEAEKRILHGLSDILGKLGSVAYLDPLAAVAREQSGGLDILTLNYDLSVEAMAAQAGTHVDRGIERWVPGLPLDFEREDGKINLVKLHGSLDWVELSGRTPTDAPSIAATATNVDTHGYGRASRPWIVVGDREKLATDGPTLALLRAAEDMLTRTHHLAVVGYSFGDAHINAMIRNWMLGDAGRTLGILDTSWERSPRDQGFRESLVRAYGAHPSENRESRIVVVEETAASGLSKVLRTRPLPTPSPYAAATVEANGAEGSRLTLRLQGPDLVHVGISVQRRLEDRGQVHWKGIDTFPDEASRAAAPVTSYNSHRTSSLDRWRRGDEATVYSRELPLDEVVVHVYGHRIDGAFPETFVVPVGKPLPR